MLCTKFMLKWFINEAWTRYNILSLSKCASIHSRRWIIITVKSCGYPDLPFFIACLRRNKRPSDDAKAATSKVTSIQLDMVKYVRHPNKKNVEQDWVWLFKWELDVQNYLCRSHLIKSFCLRKTIPSTKSSFQWLIPWDSNEENYMRNDLAQTFIKNPTKYIFIWFEIFHHDGERWTEDESSFLN